MPQQRYPEYFINGARGNAIEADHAAFDWRVWRFQHCLSGAAGGKKGTCRTSATVSGRYLEYPLYVPFFVELLDISGFRQVPQ